MFALLKILIYEFWKVDQWVMKMDLMFPNSWMSIRVLMSPYAK